MPTTSTATPADEGQKTIAAAYDALDRELPDWLGRAIRWLRNPKSRWVRIPVGLFFIACGVFWFLPVIGIEFMPVGLLLIAQDVPFMRKPVGRGVLWVIERWRDLKRRWQQRRKGR